MNQGLEKQQQQHQHHVVVKKETQAAITNHSSSSSLFSTGLNIHPTQQQQLFDHVGSAVSFNSNSNITFEMGMSPKKASTRKKTSSHASSSSCSSPFKSIAKRHESSSSPDICSSSSSPSNNVTSTHYNTSTNNSHTYNMFTEKIKKRRKAVKYETHVFTCNDEPLVASKRKLIAKYDLLRVLHLPQTLASHVLGCSFSTLKRRFYESKEELGIEKWPQFYQEVRHLPIFDYIYPMSLTFILNPVNRKRTTYADLSPPYISDSEVKNHFLQACMSK